MFHVTRSSVGIALSDESLGKYPTGLAALAVAGAYLNDLVQMNCPGIIKVFDLEAANPKAPVAELRSLP